MEIDVFSEALKSEVIKAKSELDSISLELDKARTVGLDITELTERYNALKKQIELVEKTYKL